MFSEEQAIGTPIGDTPSTNVLDWGQHGDDIDARLRWFAQLQNKPESAGSATLVVKFQTSEDNTTWETLKETPAVALADLEPGQMLVDGDYLPRKLKRYNRLVYTVGTAAFSTAPVVTAGIVRNDMPVS